MSVGIYKSHLQLFRDTACANLIQRASSLTAYSQEIEGHTLTYREGERRQIEVIHIPPQVFGAPRHATVYTFHLEQERVIENVTETRMSSDSLDALKHLALDKIITYLKGPRIASNASPLVFCETVSAGFDRGWRVKVMLKTEGATLRIIPPQNQGAQQGYIFRSVKEARSFKPEVLSYKSPEDALQKLQARACVHSSVPSERTLGPLKIEQDGHAFTYTQLDKDTVEVTHTPPSIFGVATLKLIYTYKRGVTLPSRGVEVTKELSVEELELLAHQRIDRYLRGNQFHQEARIFTETLRVGIDAGWEMQVAEGTQGAWLYVTPPHGFIETRAFSFKQPSPFLLRDVPKLAPRKPLHPTTRSLVLLNEVEEQIKRGSQKEPVDNVLKTFLLRASREVQGLRVKPGYPLDEERMRVIDGHMIEYVRVDDKTIHVIHTPPCFGKPKEQRVHTYTLGNPEIASCHEHVAKKEYREVMAWALMRAHHYNQKGLYSLEPLLTEDVLEEEGVSVQLEEGPTGARVFLKCVDGSKREITVYPDPAAQESIPLAFSSAPLLPVQTVSTPPPIVKEPPSVQEVPAPVMPPPQPPLPRSRIAVFNTSWKVVAVVGIIMSTTLALTTLCVLQYTVSSLSKGEIFGISGAVFGALLLATIASAKKLKNR